MKKQLNIINLLIVFIVMISLSAISYNNNFNYEILEDYRNLIEQNDSLIKKYQSVEDKINELNKSLTNLNYYDVDIYQKLLRVDTNDLITFNYSIDSNLLIKNNGYVYNKVLESLDQQTQKLSINISLKEKEMEYLHDMALLKIDSIHRIPSIKPVSDFNVISISSDFGYRIHPIYNKLIFHEGIDFAIKEGSPIYATADGYVEELFKDKDGYGYRIIINHMNGYKTLYAHVKKFKVRKGSKVKRGDIIALSGSTGSSTGPHLHYEVHYKNKILNPSRFYKNDKYLVKY